MAQTAKKSAEKPEPQPAREFSLDSLAQHCGELFGVTSSTFAGATAGLPARKYTVDEVRNAIIAWKKKEAK